MKAVLKRSKWKTTLKIFKFTQKMTIHVQLINNNKKKNKKTENKAHRIIFRTKIQKDSWNPIRKNLNQKV